MSRVPMGSNLVARGLGRLNEKIARASGRSMPQGISAEVIRERVATSRWSGSTPYSVESHHRAVAASDEGRFEREIVPVEVGAAGAVVLFAVDETRGRHHRSRGSRRCHRRSSLTGSERRNSSSKIVKNRPPCSSAAVQHLSLEPRARFVSFGLSGVDPYRMLQQSPEASARALARAGLYGTTWPSSRVNETRVGGAKFLADTGLQGRWDAGRA